MVKKILSLVMVVSVLGAILGGCNKGAEGETGGGTATATTGGGAAGGGTTGG